MGDNRLGELLWSRYLRCLERKDLGRAVVAAEDYVRWKQGWRRPWYRVGSGENGWPPRWTRRRAANDR